MFKETKKILDTINLGEKSFGDLNMLADRKKDMIREITKSLYEDYSFINIEKDKVKANIENFEDDYLNLLKYKLILLKPLFWFSLREVSDYDIVNIRLFKDNNSSDLKISFDIMLKESNNLFEERLMFYLKERDVKAEVEEKTKKIYSLKFDYENFDNLYVFLYDSFMIDYDSSLYFHEEFTIDYEHLDSLRDWESDYDDDGSLLVNLYIPNFHMVVYPILQFYANSISLGLKGNLKGLNDDLYQKIILLFSNLSWLLFKDEIFKPNTEKMYSYVGLVNIFRNSILDLMDILVDTDTKVLVEEINKEMEGLEVVDISFLEAIATLKIKEDLAVDNLLKLGKIEEKEVEKIGKENGEIKVYF